MQNPTFHITKALGHTGHRAEFQGETADGLPVLIYHYLGASSAQVPKWQQILFEAGQIANLDHPGLQKYPICKEDKSGIFLVQELMSSQPLSRDPDSTTSLSQFYAIAKSLLTALAYCHERKVLHKNICPESIFVDADRQAYILGNFAIFEQLNQSLMTEGPSSFNLVYGSPELTGRMNRPVEEPSDLYSLGCLFYAFLSGKPPFAFEKPNELIYAHLALVPTALNLVQSDIPAELSNLIAKLLAKEPADRYRSANGVLADIIALEKGELTRLGALDRQRTFFISDKLYGRAAQVQAAVDHFKGMGPGHMNVLSVGGFSGIGKTRLVQELYKPLTARSGSLISGKFEQYAQGKPYAGLIQALTQYCNQLLTLDNPSLVRFKQEFETLIGPSGRALTDLVPALALIVGEQPALEEVAVEVNELRLHRALESLLSLIASESTPAVLFLDDMQWVDRVSVKFLTYLLTKNRVPNLHLVFAYRSNEVDETSPFIIMCEELRHNPFLVWLDLEVPPLKLESVTALVADTLNTGHKQVETLAEAIFAKTQGNPFFVKQMLQSAYTNGIIKQSDQGWQFDVEAVASSQFADDVVSFMIGKISTYPEQTQDLSNLAAVIGTRFSLELLHQLTDLPQDVIYEHLHPLIADNLIIEGKNFLTFAHDRVQEACYKICSEEERTRRHLRVGKALDPAQIFEVVEHLNQAKSLLLESGERRNLGLLNYQAGSKALASSAYGIAYNLLTEALALCEDETFYDLYAAHAQAAHCEAHYDIAEASIKKCFALSSDVLHNERIITLYNELLFLTNRHQENIAFGLSMLARLGFKFPTRAHKGHVLVKYAKLLWAGGWRNPNHWANLPPCTDRRIAAVLNIINYTIPSCYMVNSDMFGLLSIHMAYLALKNGFNKDAAFGFGAVAVLEAGTFKLLKRGFKWRQLAKTVSEQYPDLRVAAQLQFISSLFGDQWRMPLAALAKEYKQAAALNQEVGVLHWADYALAFSSCPRVFCQQKTLNEIEDESLACLKFHTPHKDREVINNQKFIIDYIRELRGNAASLAPLLEPASYAQEMTQNGNLMSRAHYEVFAQLKFMLKEQPLENMRVGLAFAFRSIDLNGLLLELFHRFAFLIGWYSAPSNQITWSEKLFGSLYAGFSLFCMRLWTKGCPENYMGYYQLALAERESSRQNYSKAKQHFMYAIHTAQQANWFIQAFAWQRFAAFETMRGKHEIAEVFCREAYRLYKFWDCASQCDFLQQLYPDFNLKGETLPEKVAAPTSTEFSEIDKIVLGIANQSTLPELIEYALKVILETAGAQRVVLLRLDANKQPIVKACTENSQGGSKTEMYPSTCQFSSSLVTYVARTGEPHVIADSKRDEQFERDAYFANASSRSVLCFPVIAQQELVYIIYLENSLATGMFTNKQTTFLNLISSQFAETMMRMRATEELLEETVSRNMLEQMMNAIGDLLFLIDDKGKIILVNHAAMGALGYDAEGLKDTKITHWIHAEQGGEWLDGELSEFQDINCNARTRDATEIPLLVSARRYKQKDRSLGAVVYAKDLRESRMSAAIKERLERELQDIQVGMVAQSRLAALGEMAGGVAHEINTPLASIELIVGRLSKLAEQEPVDAAQLASLSALVGKTVNRIASIVRGLRTFSRDGAQDPFLPTNVKQIVDDTLALCSEKFKNAGIDIGVLVDEQLSIDCRATQISQVLLNLMNNACDAMENNEQKWIRIEASSQDTMVEITVTDSGVWASEEAKKMIFQPFFTTKEVNKGTGLGLSVSQGIIASHGGVLELDMKTVNTQFVIKLPKRVQHV
ncbi:MAG: AAA family ATPase [Myxococcota bacterium]